MKNTPPVFLAVLLCVLISHNAFAQVAINATGANPDPSAALDVFATDKGMLIPRVTLVSTTNNSTPVSNPATGLLVYNNGNTNLNAGFYVWTGMTWSALASVDQVQSMVHGPESAPVYGEIYEYKPMGSYSAIAIPSAGTYAPWTTASIGDINDMTATSSSLTIQNAGIYSINFNAVLQLPSGGKHVDGAVFVNGSRKDDMHGRAWFKEGSKSQDISFSGLISLAENDVVTVQFTMDDNGTIRVEMANLNLTRLN